MAAVNSLALTATANYFKRVYSLADKKAMLIKQNKTLSLMEKNDSRLAASDGFYITIKTHQARSTSARFEYGMADYSVSQNYRFFIDGPKSLYGKLSIDNRTLKQAKGGGALIDMKKQEMEEVSAGFLNRIENQLWNDGSGALCQVTVQSGAGAGPWVVACVTPSDIYNVEVGMVLVFGAAAGTGLKDNAYVVSSLGLQAGTFTISTTTGTDLGTDVATNDYAFVRGDANRGMFGISSFIPAVAQTTTLLGYTRTGTEVDNGWRFAYTGTIENTIKKAFSVMGRFVNRDKARFSVCLSYGDWLKLDEEMAGRVTRDPVGEQKFGTDSIAVRVPGVGTVSCIALPVMRDGRGYILDWSSWTLFTMDALPHVMDEDGMTWRMLQPGIVNMAASSAGEANASTDYLNGDGVWMGLRAWFHCVCDSLISNATFLTA